jgi:DNA-directed RNA polymerase subunit F
MTNPKVQSETPITMAELRSELARIKERDKELGFRGAKAEDYLNTFVKLSPEDSKKLQEEIEGLNIPRLGNDILIKLVDLLPKSVDEMKVILQAYHVTVTKENMQKIIDTIAKFA